jgi:hypothetical protein
VVIVTDGEPADGSAADALRAFEGLPADVLVRLCTDDRQVRCPPSSLSLSLSSSVSTPPR